MKKILNYFTMNLKKMTLDIQGLVEVTGKNKKLK